MPRAHILAAILLVFGLLAGCGGSDDSGIPDLCDPCKDFCLNGECLMVYALEPPPKRPLGRYCLTRFDPITDLCPDAPWTDRIW